MFLLLLIGISKSFSAFGNTWLMETHDIAVTDVVPNKTIIGQRCPFRVNVTVKNEGDFAETFNVTLYTDSTVIGNRQVTLNVSETLRITVRCDAPFTKGSYTLWAYVLPVQGEADIDDNTLVNGSVFVTLVGDVNGDRVKNIFDVVRAAMVYGVHNRLDPRYDPYCDIDENGMINVFDIVMIIDPYGIHW
jgi:hypothetical protein